MRLIKKIYDGIGLLSEWSAKAVMGLIVVVIIIISYEVTMRYAFNAPTPWHYVTSYMLLAVFVAMGWGYIHYLGGHVRVDVIYVKFPPKVKLLIDVFFAIVFFLPLLFMLAYVFVGDAWYAYSINEKVKEHGIWYPITFPYKTLVALGFCILWLQGVAKFVRDAISLFKGGKEPW